VDKPLAWLEASIVCSGELAEAVAEVFSRFSPNGVVISSVTRYDARGHEEIPTGDMQVVAYFPQDEQSEAIRHQLEEAIWHMSQIAPLDSIEYQLILDQKLDGSLEKQLQATQDWSQPDRFASLGGPCISRRAPANHHLARHGVWHRHTPFHPTLHARA